MILQTKHVYSSSSGVEREQRYCVFGYLNRLFKKEQKCTNLYSTFSPKEPYAHREKRVLPLLSLYGFLKLLWND